MSIGKGHGAAEPGPVPEKPQRPGKKWKLAIAGLIGVYALLAVYALISNASAIGASTSAPAAKAATPPGHATTGPPSAAKPTNLAHVPAARPARSPAALAKAPAARTVRSPAARSLAVTSIAAFGPEGTADGDNPGITFRIRHGSTDQPWYSQWYTTPEFGGLRLGTGLLLDLGKAMTVTDVRLALGSEPGADVQVRVGNAPSTDLPTVASASGADGAVRLTMSHPAKGRYVLIWFTRLPPDGHGHYQVSVYNVSVDG